MAQVTIRINGYAYTVGCEDGQEAHLQAMAAAVEDRIHKVKAIAGQSGESRMLVLASLLMADELHDLEVAAAASPAAFSPGPAAASEANGAAGATDAELETLARRAEDIAAALERH